MFLRALNNKFYVYGMINFLYAWCNENRRNQYGLDKHMRYMCIPLVASCNAHDTTLWTISWCHVLFCHIT